jgi:WD40 repeat protein
MERSMIPLRSFLAFCILCTSMHGTLAQEPVVLKHDGWVAAVTFSRDGKTLASAGADKVARLWEVGTWKPNGLLRGHTDCVCALAYSVDGELVSGSFDRSARIWNAKTLQQRKIFPTQTSIVSAIAVHPKGPIFASGSLNGKVSFWSTNEEDPLLTTYHGNKSWVNALAFNREGFQLAIGSSDGTVRTWGIRDNKTAGKSGELSVYEGGAGEVRCVAFSPDSKLLAAGNRYGTVRIWDVASRKEVKTITGHMGEVWSIAFSPDGKTLAAVDTEWKKPSKVKLYDTATWKERSALPCPGEILCIAYSPNGDWLAAGSWDKTVRVFPLGKGK